jgi:hypothetical protein
MAPHARPSVEEVDSEESVTPSPAQAAPEENTDPPNAAQQAPAAPPPFRAPADTVSIDNRGDYFLLLHSNGQQWCYRIDGAAIRRSSEFFSSMLVRDRTRVHWQGQSMFLVRHSMIERDVRALQILLYIAHGDPSTQNVPRSIRPLEFCALLRVASEMKMLPKLAARMSDWVGTGCLHFDSKMRRSILSTDEFLGDVRWLLFAEHLGHRAIFREVLTNLIRNSYIGEQGKLFDRKGSEVKQHPHLEPQIAQRCK